FGVTECAACRLPCPHGARADDEGDVCFAGHLDTRNGGCNSSPAVFSPLQSSDSTVTVCGTYGTYARSETQVARDTDWYQIDVVHPETIELCVQGEAIEGTQIYILDGRQGCPPAILASRAGDNFCQQLCCQASLTPGTYWLWVGPASFTGELCTARYTMTLTGHTRTVAVLPISWSHLKVTYR